MTALSSNKIDVAMLRVIGQTTPDGEETKNWFVTKEVDGGEGNQFYIVEDGEGGHESLTRAEVTGEVKEINIDDYVATGMTGFDQQQAGKAQAEQNKMTIDGKVLTRMPNDEGKYEGGEFWLDENSQPQEVAAEEIAAWEKSKQGNHNSNPNIVNRTFGKIEVIGTKDESGNIIVTEPMTLDQVDALKAEVERTTAGKATVQMAQITAGNDGTLQDTYEATITPVAVAPVVDPEIKAQIETETKTSYTYKGNPTPKGMAEAVVRNAILTKNQAKLAGLVINNDPELTAAIEKAFPKPKAKFTIGKSKVTVQDALDHILIADNLDELEQLKAENIEAEPDVKAAYELKLQEFTPIQNETPRAEVDTPTGEPIVDNSFGTNGIAESQDESGDVSRDIPELKPKEVNPQVDLEPIQETEGSSAEQSAPDASTSEPVINQNVKPSPEKQNTLQGNEGDSKQKDKPKLKVLSDYKKGEEWKFTAILKEDYEKTHNTDTYNLWRNDIKLDEAIEQSGKGNFTPLMNIENAYIQRKFDKEQKLKAEKAEDIAKKSTLTTPNRQPDKPREATGVNNGDQQAGEQRPVDGAIGVKNEGEGNQGEGIQSKIDKSGLILTELNGKFYIKTPTNQMLGHGKSLKEAYDKAKDMYPQAFVNESKGQAEVIAKDEQRH